MKRRIVVDRGRVNDIAHVMKLTRETVSRSLNYQSNSMLARKVRFVAKSQYDGVEVGKD